MKRAADIALARLLQLASPALPVGAYSYSQGLEAVVTAGTVHDTPSAQRWIDEVLEHSVGRMEAPVLLRLHEAWRTEDEAGAARWNAFFLASRESSELRAESAQMGYSLAKLLAALDVGAVPCAWDEVSFPAAYAYGAARWNIAPGKALTAYLWSWVENQVLAALKTVPLGQTDGQKMMLALGERAADVAARAATLDDEALGNFAPGLALLSARHETQYSRLFRS